MDKPPVPQMRPQPLTLSDADSTQIFNSTILPLEFRDVPASPSSPPLAVLAVGQTGAGKSNLSPHILAAFKDAGRAPVHLIADTYKTYHPAYSDLVQSNPAQASPATSPDARRWLAMAVMEAAKRKADVVLESACRQPEDFIELAQILRDAGYRIEVLLLAVAAPLSRIGLMIRYRKRLPEGHSKNLPVRLTPAKIHDTSYLGLLDVAAFLDNSNVADQVLVIRRGNLVAHSKEISDPRNPAGIIEALSVERKRPLDDEELNRANADLEYLSQFPQHGDELEDIRRTLQLLNSPKDKDGKNLDFPKLTELAFATAEMALNGTMGPNVLHMGLSS